MIWVFVAGMFAVVLLVWTASYAAILRDSVLGVLRHARRPLTTLELTEELVAVGHSRFWVIGALHSVLERLEDAGWVVSRPVGGHATRNWLPRRQYELRRLP